jgi:serine protease Do
MKKYALALAALAALVGFLLGLVAAVTRAGNASPGPAAGLATAPGRADRPPVPVATPPAAPVAPPPGAGVDFAAVAARVNAAVVNVDAASRDSDARSRVRRRWDDEAQEGSGSGFIVDPSGYILTNHHVVERADRVAVTLADGRLFRASIVGVDPALDVALLRIPVSEPLPVAPLGDSDALRAGEWVCAIGNPLGYYVHSVTVGVVSFLGRKLFDQSLDAFIQTDAAISFGSSGGPLINARGEVVGITTAISAQASNIGFAIPISQVIAILPQLRTEGRVARGFLGISLAAVTPALKRALELEPDRGALIQEVSADTPAERAGLRAYDVIVAVDGLTIRSDDELTRYIAGRLPGTTTRLDVWRDGAHRSVTVKLTERPLPRSARTADGASPARPAAQDPSRLGVVVRDLDRATAARMRIPETVQGVLVADVDSAGPARLARVRTGQIILEINRRRVQSVGDYRAVVSALAPGAAAAMLIYDPLVEQRAIYLVVPDSQP